MTKPFPCCCQCIFCPQYGSGNNWMISVSGLTGPAPGVFFSSSTTGNPLHTDLNALSPVSFTFGAGSGSAPRSYFYVSGNLFPGSSWTYTGISGYPFGVVSNVRFQVAVRDNCSKVWLFSAIIIVDILGPSGGTILTFNNATQPASANCGASLTQNANSTGGIYLNVAGSITLDPP